METENGAKSEHPAAKNREYLCATCADDASRQPVAGEVSGGWLP